MFHCLKTRKNSLEGKICFLALISRRFKKGIKLFDFQIHSYSFQDPKQFLENIPSPKQEEIVLPFDL